MISTPGEPADRTATELVRAYATRDLSPVDAIKSVLARIESHNHGVNAYRVVNSEAALAEAEQSERRWLRGVACGPLDGVPVSIKDVLLTHGEATLRGSLGIDPAGPWLEDAPCVARLRAGGAVLIGKTTTPEYGWKGVTDSPLTGITRNPWNIDRTSGGSSGGAAAAVAAGMGPLGMGTDGGGSVRIPASFCGTVGFKPTYGAIPQYPPSPFGTLAHVGPIGRTVEDVALALDVISAPDARDWSAGAPPTTRFRHHLDTPLAGVRIAYSRTLGFAEVDPGVSAVVAAAVAQLADLGAEVTEADPGFDDPLAAFECLWFCGAAKAIEHLDVHGRSQLDPGLLAGCIEASNYSVSDYLEATAQRMQLGVTMGRFHERFDLLVTPTMPIVAFDAGRDVPTERPVARWTGWTPFTYPFNLTQQPAISVPCGFSAHLPVGLQIVGPRHADARVLAAAKAFQDSTAWFRHRPDVSAL